MRCAMGCVGIGGPFPSPPNTSWAFQSSTQNYFSGLCSATAILPIILLFRKVAYMRIDFESVLVWTVILACILLGIAGGMSGAVAPY
jgi:hypothetical protein